VGDDERREGLPRGETGGAAGREWQERRNKAGRHYRDVLEKAGRAVGSHKGAIRFAVTSTA
jgi:hypothetical protein